MKIKNLLLLTILLTTIFNVCFALDTQLNFGTLGLGVNVRQSITDRLGITGSFDYNTTSDKLADETITVMPNRMQPAYLRTYFNYQNSYSLNNMSFGLGLDYILIKTKPLQLSAEGGVKYNVANFTSTGSMRATVASLSTSSVTMPDNNNLSANYNTIAPYAQFNVRAYLTDKLYLVGQLGAEWYNLKINSNSTGSSLVTKPFVPIAGIGIGYSF